MSTYVLFYFCNWFGISIRTSMLAISGSFLNCFIPDRFISFTGRYLWPPKTYKNGGLLWDLSLLPDTSSDIAIIVGRIREFCALVNLSGTCPNSTSSIPIGQPEIPTGLDNSPEGEGTVLLIGHPSALIGFEWNKPIFVLIYHLLMKLISQKWLYIHFWCF